MGMGLIVHIIQSKNDIEKLADCSKYTIAHVTRVYMSRGQTRVTYQYKLNSDTAEIDEGVNNSDTNEYWFVDRDKLRKRRLLLRVYCTDINVHRIVWDVTISDTLQHIPAEGWNKIPLGAKKSID